MKSSTHSDDIVEKIIHIVLKSDLETLAVLSIDKIAGKLNRNRSFLSRKFKKHTNLLLSEFIISEKIKRAEDLIKSRSDLTIEEISGMVGFYDARHLRMNLKKNNRPNPRYQKKIYSK